MKDKIVTNIVSLMTGSILLIIINFILFIYVAKLLGPESIGDYTVVTVIVGYFIMFASLGLDNYSMVEFLKKKDKNKIYNSNLTNKLLYSLFFYIVLLLFLFHNNFSLSQKYLLGILGLKIFTATGFNNQWYYKATENMKIIAFTNALKGVLTLAFFFLMFKLKRSILALVLAQVLSEIIISTVLIVKCKEPIRINSKYINFSLLRKSYPFLISGLLATVNINIDTLFINYFKSAREVGLYAANYKIINLITMIFSIMFIAVKPRLIKDYHEEKYASLKIIIGALKKTIAFFSILAITFCYYNKEFILNFLYGTSFLEASNIFLILLVSVCVLLFREVYGYQLMSYGLEKKYMNILMKSSLINVILNAIFIKKYGIIAAAFATLFTEIVNYFFMKKEIKKVININLEKYFILKTILFFISINIVMKALSIYLAYELLNIFCSIILYLLFLITIYYKDIKIIKKSIIDKGKKMNNKKRITTLFPEGENVHLIKSCGMIPYILFKYYNFDSTFVSYENGEYPYFSSNVKGLKNNFLEKKTNNKLFDSLFYLLKFSKKIDVLHLYHLTKYSTICSVFYKLLNPKGIVYLKLDNTDESTYLKNGKVSKIREIKFKFAKTFNIMSSESLNFTKNINQNTSLNIKYIQNGFYSSKEALNYDKKENIILTVGRIGTEQKANNIMLEAFKRISHQIPEWKLKLVGPITPNFQEFINDFFKTNPKLKEKIIFTGEIRDRKKLDLEYEKAKIFTLSSIFEGFPTVSLEAMKYGCVPVISKFTSFQEITNYGELGESFEINNIEEYSEKLLKICLDEDRIKKESKKNYDLAYSKYYWPKTCEKLNNYILKEVEGDK